MGSPKKVATGKESTIAELRRKAEDQWKRQHQKAQKTSMPEADLRRILHELEVHQIELEVQQDELVRSHAELEESLNQYSELYDFAPVGYFTLLRDGTIQRSNLTGARLLGANRSELIQRRFGLFVTYENRPAFSAFLQEVFSKDGNPGACEISLHAENVDRIWVHIEAARSQNDMECKLAVVDITDRKRAEDDLQALNAELEQHVQERTAKLTQANIELQRANRTKDEFLAMMSHELRTPLTSILGISEILIEQIRGPLNEKQVQAIQWISNSGYHLLSLINDILDVSKIEAGKLHLHPDVISIQAVCEASLNFIQEAAIKKSITVDFDQDPSVTILKADPQRLKQILVNLLSNAVKFTPEKGNVSLEVFTNENRDQVRFVVSDTGIGIAASNLPKLFAPFSQVDSRLSRQYEGTGLGLVLVFKYTEMHGGSVQVESELGKGSRFTIQLPIGLDGSNVQNRTEPERSVDSETQAEEEITRIQDISSHKSILLAEDNEASIVAVGDYLEELGYQVIVARNGYEAVELAETVGPDIILMDIQMPIMDGLEAIGILRKNPRFTTTPVIALTALAMPGDRERCLKAGANEYMSKPVSLKGLTSTIWNLLQDKRPE